MRLVPEFKAFWTALQRWFPALSQQLQSFCLTRQGAEPFDLCAGRSESLPIHPQGESDPSSSRLAEASELHRSLDISIFLSMAQENENRQRSRPHMFSPASALQALRHSGFPCDSISQPWAQSHLQHTRGRGPRNATMFFSVLPQPKESCPLPHLAKPISLAQPKSPVMSSGPSHPHTYTRDAAVGALILLCCSSTNLIVPLFTHPHHDAGFPSPIQTKTIWCSPGFPHFPLLHF